MHLFNSNNFAISAVLVMCTLLSAILVSNELYTHYDILTM